MSKKLSGNTTHSIPRRISSELGNKDFLTLRGLLDKEFSGGAMTAIMCATLALITAVGPPDWATKQFPTNSSAIILKGSNNEKNDHPTEERAK